MIKRGLKKEIFNTDTFHASRMSAVDSQVYENDMYLKVKPVKVHKLPDNVSAIDVIKCKPTPVVNTFRSDTLRIAQ